MYYQLEKVYSLYQNHATHTAQLINSVRALEDNKSESSAVACDFVSHD